jgi:mannose-6-phosphate isomerase-like protein (cupin superfamily)
MITDEMLEELGDDLDLEVAGSLALLAGDPAESAALRARLFETLQHTHRWDDLETEIATLIDLDLDATRALLLAIDGAGPWEPGPVEHVELLHFDGGSAVADAITGFVRIAPGEAFPEHEHMGDEAVLVLQGGFRDSSGSVHGRGELVRMPRGSSHSFVASGAIPLVYLVVLEGGVKIGDVLITPGDPRG